LLRVFAVSGYVLWGVPKRIYFGYMLVTQWRTIALSHMVEFAGIEPPKGTKKRSS
jgi:hypothetical protein